MNRLTRIEVKGFRSLRDVAIDLTPINVLIGANGSGKSNFLSFLTMLSHMMQSTGRLREFVATSGGAASILSDGPKITPELSAKIVGEFEGEDAEYDLRIGSSADDKLVIHEERYASTGPKHVPRAWNASTCGIDESHLAGGKPLPDTPEWWVSRLLSLISPRYQFFDTSTGSRLRARVHIDSGSRLSRLGDNVAAVLIRLQREHARAYERIVDTLRLMIPGFGDFVFEPTGDYLLLQWREQGKESVFNAGQASDGFLRIVCLTTLLNMPPDQFPDIVLIDEPELGLHPAAITILAAMIHGVGDKKQFFIATQSADLLRKFDASEIVVADVQDGYTRLRRPDEKVLQVWLDQDYESTYDIGDLWLMNSLGGRP